MEKPTRLFDFPEYQLATSPLEKSLTSKQGDKWVSYSTQEFVDHAAAISRALLKLGIEPGDKVAMISHNNRSEWNIMDIGILQIGAIDVPIYPTMSESDYEYIMNHAEVKMCVVSNEELFQKVSNVMPKVDSLTSLYTFEDVAGAKNWRELLELGKDGDQARVDEIKASVDQDDLATLIYTSGTTGLPKGVMLTHRNIASNAVDSSVRLPQFVPGDARVLSFLPVCHIFERMLHYLYYLNGASIYFAESLETIKEDLNMCKPHMFTAVPRLLEKFYDGIVAKGTSAGGIKAKIFSWAVGVALQWEPDRRNGGFYEWKLGIARKLVFSKVKEALGLTEILAVASGSAALQARLARFFNGADIPVLEGYGLTETSPVISVNALNQPNMLRVGSVGTPIPNVEVKIAEDGEILAKGPNIMIGYYKKEELTNEVLTDGWFHTGDIGVVEDGFLRITDRKKEMFKTSGGKYVAPQVVENALKESILIEQVMVVGEGQKFPGALIVPSFDAVKEWCRRHDHTYPGDDKIADDKVIHDRLWKDIHKANERFGSWEQVKKIAVLPALFTVEGGELTPTLKLKRRPIKAKYEAQINGLYE